MHLFQFHTGFEAQAAGSNFVTNCPFCDKEDHFFYNPTTFLWDCKVCSRTGNPVEFIRQLYNMFETQTKACHTIAEARGLPIGAVSLAKVKYNPLNGSYLIPTYKFGKINNLYKAVQVTKTNKETGQSYLSWTVMASPHFEHTLMNWDETFPDKLWITEGHWDRMAANAVLSGKDIGATGVPGCGVWKPAWCEAIAEKDIVFCYDNDTPGKEGYLKVILKHIASSQFKPRSISVLQWPADKKIGYDLNDAYREYGKGTYNKVSEWIVPYKEPEGVIVVKTSIDTVEADHSCTTYEELLRRFASVYHSTDSIEQALLLVLASIYSVKVEGEQLWIRLIGPPSAGKTTVAKTVSGAAQVVLKSTFTGLFSGWKDDKDQDASLIPLIAGKTLIVKDADALLRQKNVEQIFSELRDFYDKDSSTFFKNMVSHDYRNIRSTMILCGTNVLRRSDQSFLGERFMDYELMISEADRMQIEERMLQRSIISATNISTIPPETPVVAAAKGFIELLMQREPNVKLSSKIQTDILTMARTAACMRTRVDREKFGLKDITFEPVIEVPARLIGQLTKLFICGSVVMNSEEPPVRVERLAKKVTQDIVDLSSPRYKVCGQILDAHLSRDEILEATGLTIERINHELGDLVALKLVDTIAVKNNSGSGRKVFKFRLKEQLAGGLKSICQ